MIQKLVSTCLKNPVSIYGVLCLLVVVGLYSYRALDVEAYPNPVPPLVEVIAQPAGMSAEDVEKYVTLPLETALAGMPGLEHRRSQSIFGLSDIKCYFNWTTTYEAARQEVLNRLHTVNLPNGITAEISPWNAVGEVFRYELKGQGFSLKELKTQQDWVLERQFKQVPGVVDVISFGGETKEYQVQVDPFRLKAHHVLLSDMMKALGRSNQNVGGQRLNLGEQAFTVRAVGLLQDVHDIEEVVISSSAGVPVRVKDIATVRVGTASRLGVVGRDDGSDIVNGSVIMRYGESTEATLLGIYDRLKYIKEAHILPAGMEIMPYYDRGALVKTTTHTVLENLLVGMALVGVILFLFLGHGKASLITALNIPLALLIAFTGMVLSHTQANLISLGAVDFGIVVDSSVIVMENIFRHLGSHGKGTIRDRILEGTKSVARPLGFSTLILAVAFLPLFTMTGVAGVIFSPMAKTYALAIGGAIVLALSLTPVFAQTWMKADEEEKDSFVMRVVHKLDAPVYRLLLHKPRRVLAAALTPVFLGLFSMSLLGGEFMPKLEEGNFWIRATLPTSISLQTALRYVGSMRRVLRGCDPSVLKKCDETTSEAPEVVTVISQLGRPDDGTDTAGFQNIEFFVPLKPTSQWRPNMTKEQLTEKLSHDMNVTFPGVAFNFSQMISDNVEEAVSGVKGENSIKVIGPTVSENESFADSIENLIRPIRGIEDLDVLRSSGQPAVEIVADRKACSRYGLNTSDVEEFIEAAIGGKAVTKVLEGESRFDLTVRWQEPYRKSLESIRELLIPTAMGGDVPLGEIANIRTKDSSSVVYREDGQRYTPIKFSVRGRDLKSTVEEAKSRIATYLKLPYNNHLEWSGEMNQLHEAINRLYVILPITLLLILALVKSSVKTWRLSFIVFCNIPVACSGGMFMLFVSREHFSVSAAMGLISILGIAVQYAILLIAEFSNSLAQGEDPLTAAVYASQVRTRPILMTTLVALFGLLPAALSHGVGSQTQKPLALVVIGGALFLVLFARPILVALLALIGVSRTRRVTEHRREHF